MPKVSSTDNILSIWGSNLWCAELLYSVCWTALWGWHKL